MTHVAFATSVCALIGCSQAAASQGGGAHTTVVTPTPQPSKGNAAPSASVAAIPSSAPASPEDKQKRLIGRMLRRVSQARALDATKPVPGVFLSRDALMARVKAHVTREVPREAIREEGLVQQLLGFIPTRFDYEAETYALLQDQLAGFYEPADATMYMASDLDDDNASATLAHELVHALQDQHWDLGSRSVYAPGQGDRTSAFSALAEGDATSAMADVLLSRSQPNATALDLPDELFTEQVIGSMNVGPTGNAPHVMRMALVAPYIDGTLFVHALRRKGGWSAVNRAWDNAPTTSEQILHVNKWEAHEPPIAIPDPPVHTLGAGWAVADSDTYGEMGVRLALGEWLGAEKAGVDAAGWGGDRGILVKKGERYAFAWRIRFDDAMSDGDRSSVRNGHSTDPLAGGAARRADAFAVRAWAALAAVLEAKVGRARDKDPTPFLCIERAELGPLAIARRGRDLILVAGPASVGSRWSSAADCSIAKAWILEIATAR
jgi:hypothetical protein